MMLQSKLDRAMNWLKEKSAKDSERMSSEKYHEENEIFESHDTRSEWLAEEGNSIEIENRDIPGIILSAFIVFAPIFIILIIILFLVIRW